MFYYARAKPLVPFGGVDDIIRWATKLQDSVAIMSERA